jgi:CRP-like cAMP-binding protein
VASHTGSADSSADTAPPALGAEGTFWAALRPSDASELAALCRTRTFARGAALLHERQLGDHVIVIRSGWVKVVLSGAVLGFRGPGELIGEIAPLDGGVRSATVYAVDRVEALTLPASAFRRYVEDHPAAALALIGILTSRLRDADAKRAEFTSRVAIERVAARLLELGDLFGRREEDGARICIPVSQEDLAGTTYASLESVARALRDLRRAQSIETRRGEIVIVDRDAVERLANHVR